MNAQGLSPIALVMLMLLTTSFLNGYPYANDSMRVYSSTTDRAISWSFPALIDVILLDDNLTPTTYAIPGCIEVDEGSIYVNVENAMSEGGGVDYELRVRIYQNCMNISGVYSIRIVNVSKIYYEEINWTTIVLNVNLYSSMPVAVAGHMGASKMEIRYGVLNSTHYRVRVILRGVFSPMLGDAELFDEIRIEYVVSSRDWSSYVIGEDGPEFVGYLPIALPVLSPQKLMDIIEERLQSYIDYIAKNIWMLENIVNKALMEENQTRRNELIWWFTRNETSKVFTLNYPYSAGNLKVVLGYTNINVRSDERIVKKNLSGTLELLQLDRAKIFRMGLNRTIDDYLLPAIRAYLDEGDLHPLLNRLISLLKLRKLPMEMGFTGEAPFISDVVLPFENEAGFAFLTLPLPRDMAEVLNARYLYIVMFRVSEAQEPPRESFVRIVYEREFMDSVRVNYLNETLICVQNAVLSFESSYRKFIYDAIVNGINVARVAEIKDVVLEALEPCRRLLAGIKAGGENKTNITPSEDDIPQTTTLGHSTLSSNTDSQTTAETPAGTRRTSKAMGVDSFMILLIIIVVTGTILGFRIVKKP